ncbi:MAG: VacJ family lipoprotein [Pseudomonadota bacterium]
MKKMVLMLVCFFVLSLFASNSSASDTGSANSFSEKPRVSPLPQAFHCKESFLVAQNQGSMTPEETKEPQFVEGTEPIETIPDPLQSYNRPFFNFNDKLYFYLLKPVAKGYGKLLPKRARISIQNFFLNLYAPVRMLNCGLQGNTKGAFTEFSRFATNTTLGIAGFFDPAKSLFHLEMQEEDFGQTLGCFKGPGFYLNAPFAGPTSLRDGIGNLVDIAIVPSVYVIINYAYYYTIGPMILEVINRTSLKLGEYEELKRAALDPYASVRDAYFQHREDLIKR